MNFYLDHSLAPATLRSYQTAWRAWDSYAAAHDIDDAAGVPTDAAETWLASLGASGRLAPASIAAYKSAVLTRHELYHTGANAWDTQRVSRILRGIARTAVPLTPAPTLALTPAIIAVIAPGSLLGTDLQSRMLYAAATMATHAMLRPSEMLGTPAQKQRALRADDITFFAWAGTHTTCALYPHGTDLGSASVPDRYSIRLGVTKADQGATNPPIVVAAPSAVRALWTWMHARRDSSTLSPLLFVARPRPGAAERPLSIAALCRAITDALDAAGVDHPKVTGKTFRRGGASALTAAGAPTAAIANMMRHRSLAVQDRYSSAAAKAARLVALSRSLDGPQ